MVPVGRMPPEGTDDTSADDAETVDAEADTVRVPKVTLALCPSVRSRRSCRPP